MGVLVLLRLWAWGSGDERWPERREREQGCEIETMTQPPGHSLRCGHSFSRYKSTFSMYPTGKGVISKHGIDFKFSFRADDTGRDARATMRYIICTISQFTTSIALIRSANRFSSVRSLSVPMTLVLSSSISRAGSG